MLIPFDIVKVAQAAVVLLKAEPSRRMGRLRLIKLLYIADRELLKERGRPITGDRPVAMEHGPILSRTYDLIKGKDAGAPVWQKYVRTDGARDVALGDDPGVTLLSRREISKLQEVFERFEHQEDYQVADYTHEFPEWKKNAPLPHGSNKISLDDLLIATGQINKKDSLLDRQRAEEAAARAFGESRTA